MTEPSKEAMERAAELAAEICENVESYKWHTAAVTVYIALALDQVRAEEREAQASLLRGRDDFITHKKLWAEFVESLPAIRSRKP